MNMQGRLRILFVGILVIAAVCAGCSAKEKVQDIAEKNSIDSEPELIHLPNDGLDDTAVVYTEYAEEEEYPRLAEFLAEYYDIKEEKRYDTRYYYNYYDLNNDGKDEIITAVISEELTSRGGDPVLFLKEEDEGFFVLEEFEQVHTPIAISEAQTNGWHDIILNVYGGGMEEGYLLYRHGVGGTYQEGDSILYDEMPRDNPITQILSNNLIDDMDRGDYMTIAPREEG